MARGEWGSGPPLQLDPWQVRIQFQMGTTKAQTGFKVRRGALEVADAETIAENVSTWVNDHFRQLFYESDKMLSVDVVNLRTLEGHTIAYPNLSGTIVEGTNKLPGFVQCAVSLVGELRARYGRGGMLWPVRSEAYTTDEQLNATGLAAFTPVITALDDAFLGDPLTNEYVLINAHGVLPPRAATPTRPARPEVPASWYDVTAIKLNPILSHCASRRLGRGS